MHFIHVLIVSTCMILSKWQPFTRMAVICSRNAVVSIPTVIVYAGTFVVLGTSIFCLFVHPNGTKKYLTKKWFACRNEATINSILRRTAFFRHRIRDSNTFFGLAVIWWVLACQWWQTHHWKAKMLVYLNLALTPIRSKHRLYRFSCAQS